MGKHLWRKQTSVRVGKNGPGCIWTVFRLLNYHPWQNVKRMLMLPYIKQKSRKKRAKMINEQIGFSKMAELEEDTVTKYYSVNSRPSGTGSSSRKKSIKNRIKALLAYSLSNCGKVNSIQEHELLAPTLISLLKASNPKLLAAINPAHESANLSRAEIVKHNELMEEYVGVFELFKVDQDAFLEILQDHSPRKKHRLVKSGSFPFSNNAPSRNSVTFGKTPKKLEHKLNEVWPPIPNQQGYELRKSRSQNIGRSSSLSKSLRLTNENLGLRTYLSETDDHDCETNNGIFSVSGIYMHSQQQETEKLENCSIIEDSFEKVEDVQSHDGIDSNESLQYVKFVLDIIGLTTTNDQLGSVWHTLHQPLDPALFDDVEIFYPFEPISERRILFDLLNEALFEIHEHSYTYYPKPLTSSCVVHHIVRKVGNHVLDQIWKFIREYLLWQPETDVDFDSVIVHELSRHQSGWRNLQRDTEVLAVDLEDWIFDELLGEIVCCQVTV
ncbi:uncharacterized protein LOC141593176 [Silene latifolia]|uniref:uncharacterized protein LOC141593176 n=1 Tax=Silene latifolia TaxID=37657 RepID=UPI003D77DAFD